MPDMILGVDGGSSKTHLALADRTGRLRAFVAGPGTNHEGRGMKPIFRIFKEMVGRACRIARCRPNDIKAGCFGLSGGDIPEDFDHLSREAIRPLHLGGPSLVTNDAFIALFNDRYRDSGVAVTSGSWTKWLGMHRGRMFMHDGWGHLGLRDRAMVDLCRVAEGYRDPSPYTEALRRFLKLSSYEEYVRLKYYGEGRRAYVKNYTPLQLERQHRIPEFLTAQAARGSREALGVLDRYAEELVDGTMAVIRRLRMRGVAHDVVLSGSVLAGNPALRRLFRRHLAARAPRARVVTASARPIRGALMYAAHRAGWTLPASALREPTLTYG